MQPYNIPDYDLKIPRLVDTLNYYPSETLKFAWENKFFGLTIVRDIFSYLCFATIISFQVI